MDLSEHRHPLIQPCTHFATEAEQRRDPLYRACDAQPGERCRWAARHDGLPDPPFHTERLEAALPPPNLNPQQTAAFREAVLASGLV